MVGVEILHRDVITASENGDSKTMSVKKLKIQGEKCQASYNSYGHIAIRFIDGESDKLLVFDRRSSLEIIRFCREIFCTKTSGIPF